MLLRDLWARVRALETAPADRAEATRVEVASLCARLLFAAHFVHLVAAGALSRPEAAAQVARVLPLVVDR